MMLLDEELLDHLRLYNNSPTEQHECVNMSIYPIAAHILCPNPMQLNVCCVEQHSLN